MVFSKTQNYDDNLYLSDGSRDEIQKPKLQLSGDLSEDDAKQVIKDVKLIEVKPPKDADEQKIDLSMFKTQKGENDDSRQSKFPDYVQLRPKNIPRRVLLGNLVVVERYLDEEEEGIKSGRSDEDSDQKSLASLSPGKSPDKEVDGLNEVSKQDKKNKKKEVEPTEEEIKALAKKIAVRRDAKRRENSHRDIDQLSISMIGDDGELDLPKFKARQVDLTEDPMPLGQAKSLSPFADEGDDGDR